MQSPIIKIESLARALLIKKYDKDPSFHDIKIINDIIFNEETHFVAMFKEYLIYEEMNEFLKRYYYKDEIAHKMPKILLFYEKYSKIYANYTQLPESKYMYKNIKRKQKMIDKLQEMEEEELDIYGHSEYSDLFTTRALESINSVTMSLYKGESISYTESDSCSINHVIDNISFYEKKKNDKKNTKKTNTKPIANKQNDANKKVSTLLSPNLKSKVIQTSKQKEKINYYLFSKNQNLRHKIFNEKSLSKNTSVTKAVLSTNSSRSKTERIISSPTNSRLKHISKLSSSSNRMSGNTSLVSKGVNCSTGKNKKVSTKASKPLYYSKIFSNRNSQKNIYTINSSQSEKSKSTPKNAKNYSIVNNVNIINNIQTGSTQINIYNYCDLLKSLHFGSGSLLHSTIKKSIKSPARESAKSQSKPKKNDMNIRKMISKNIFENECSTDRYGTNNNFFEKLGKNFFTKKHSKINSAANSKINTTECKINSRTNHNSGNLSKNKNLSTKQPKDCKIKLKNLYDLSHLMLKNSGGMVIHSERNKKSKISFK